MLKSRPVLSKGEATEGVRQRRWGSQAPPWSSEDTIEGPADARTHLEWTEAFRRHLGAYLGNHVKESRARFDIGPAPQFKGRVRSGCIGPLRYLRTHISHAFSDHEAAPRERTGHCFLLVLSGHPTLETRRSSVTARPGDFVLINGAEHLRLSADSGTEILALREPIHCDMLRWLNAGELLHRPGGSDVAAMLSRWAQDACTDHHWQSPAVAQSISQTLRQLSQGVLLDRPQLLPQRLDRQAIEQQVLSRLEDDTLSIDAIAQFFGCSVRTLYRVFKHEGDESIERYIQRQRIEACAARLRNPVEGATLSLTDLALQFCFSSSSQFSTAFRAHFGVSPTAYRQSPAWTGS